MTEWISIADRLPEPGDEVWAYDKEMGVTIGRYGRGRWYDVYGDNDGLGDDGLYEVTHWNCTFSLCDFLSSQMGL
jgi:hypothetical protein